MDTTHIRVLNPIGQRTWRTLAEAANLRGISASRKSRSVVRNLTAFRCQRCGHDQVLDSLGADAQLGDLDDEDYTATGPRA